MGRLQKAGHVLGRKQGAHAGACPCAGHLAPFTSLARKYLATQKMCPHFKGCSDFRNRSVLATVSRSLRISGSLPRDKQQPQHFQPWSAGWRQVWGQEIPQIPFKRESSEVGNVKKRWEWNLASQTQQRLQRHSVLGSLQNR